jgi:hypothetical protein
MSIRHYLIIKNKDLDEIVDNHQILGNNDYFDEEFYQNLNINIDEDCMVEQVKINYTDFLYEWNRWLDRNPEKRGLPKIPESVKNQEDIKTHKECIYLHYLTCQSYEQQLFEVTRSLYPQYIDWSGNIRDGWELIFECF